jgi:hypothetical protein
MVYLAMPTLALAVIATITANSFASAVVIGMPANITRWYFHLLFPPATAYPLSLTT